MNKWTLIGLGLLLITALAVPYYTWVGAIHPVSDSSAVWGTFGDYVGGIGGTILSFAGVVLVIKTLLIQIDQDLKRDQIAHVTAADNGIDHWLQRQIACSTVQGKTIEFGDVVWGLVKPNYVSTEEFAIACERLLKLTSLYCEALALYRANVDSHFVFRYHLQKAQSLVKFLQGHKEKLGQMGGPTLMICLHLLEGSGD